jgi:predicted acyl esterase
MDVRENETCETRDGVELAVDVYLPEEGGEHPALLAFSPYGKDLQRATFFLPRQPHESTLWNGAIEAGDTECIVEGGYAHVVGDVRGTGASGGDYRGVFDTDGQDGYDLVEWIADREWCDGQVGLAGRSWFGTNQLLVAAENPPSLIGAFPSGVYTDLYREVAYHGGALNLFPQLWWNYIVDENWTSRERAERGEEAFEAALAAKLDDPDVRNYPDLYTLLQYPEQNPQFVDTVLNDTDNEFYAERSPHTVLDEIDCPVYLSGAWKGTHTAPTYTAYEGIEADDLKVMMTPPRKLERPYHEYTGEMLRWYDHLLADEGNGSGNTNGIGEEPPVKTYISGAERWRFEDDLLLDRTEWREYYLRNHDRLLPDPDPLGEVPPSGFVQEPLTIGTEVASSAFRTPPITEPTEITGPIALVLYASIDSTDTTWMARLYDVSPDGSRTPLGRGYLRASHRALDEDESEPYAPHHPHEESEPVTPGEVIEYHIGIQPIGHEFGPGHRLELELRSMEIQGAGEDFLIESFHLPRSETIAHELYHDAEHPSHLLLPFVPETDPERYIEAGDPAHPGPSL